MHGMYDASCPKCHRRFGWRGQLVDRPPCPQCGHAVPRAALEREQAKLERQHRLLDLPSVLDLGACRSCGAEIFWVETVCGKRMPVDPEPVADGNVLLAEGGARVLSPDEGVMREGPLYVSHFATCPNSAQHRRKT